MGHQEQKDHCQFCFILQCCVKSRLHSAPGSFLLLKCSVDTVDTCVHVHVRVSTAVLNCPVGS